ncbi:MAG: ATP-dependent 6-phosphofructokinase [Phycisphaerae bacterium]
MTSDHAKPANHATQPSRIAILTGGGDCPGLNAVIRIIALDAMARGIDVMGVEEGYLGLVENRIRSLGMSDLDGLLRRGGTILGSNNKSNPAKFIVGKNPDGSTIVEDKTRDCIRHLSARGIDAMVIIGGDGTLTTASLLASMGVRVIGVPKTIDNDIEGTDITFGFQTAVDTATDALDKVRTTADSHHRAMVVELMGRNAGWITLHAGIASASDVILVPEIPFDLDALGVLLRDRQRRGMRSTLLAVAEGARPKGGAQVVAKVDPTSPDPIRLGGVGRFVAERLEEMTGIESRYVVLGHVQRGGVPCAFDRVLCTAMGHHAMTLLLAGRFGRMVAMRGGTLTDIGLDEPAGRQRTISHDHPLIAAARAAGTSFGDSTPADA